MKHCLIKEQARILESLDFALGARTTHGIKPDMSLLAPDDHWLIFATLALLAWVAFRLETTRLGSRLSGAVIALLLAMAAANLGLLPAQAIVYDRVWSYLLPFGLAVLLLRANLHALLRETGRLALLFLVGSAATVAGAGMAFWPPLNLTFSSLIPVRVTPSGVKPAAENRREPTIKMPILENQRFKRVTLTIPTTQLDQIR